MTVSAASECTRHGLHPTREKHKPDDWFVYRCFHIDQRFVVDIRCDRWRAVHCDYVEDLPNGDLIVEPGDEDDWELFTSRLLVGDGPIRTNV